MIAIDEPVPSLGYHGGDVAAPVFSAVVGPALLYLGVPPDREEIDRELWPGEMIASEEDPPQSSPEAEPTPLAEVDVEPVENPLPDFSGLTARQAVVRSAEMGLRATLHGQGWVNRQTPAPGTAMDEAEGDLELWLGAGVGGEGR